MSIHNYALLAYFLHNTIIFRLNINCIFQNASAPACSPEKIMQFGVRNLEFTFDCRWSKVQAFVILAGRPLTGRFGILAMTYTSNFRIGIRDEKRPGYGVSGFGTLDATLIHTSFTCLFLQIYPNRKVEHPTSAHPLRNMHTQVSFPTSKSKPGSLESHGYLPICTNYWNLT